MSSLDRACSERANAMMVSATGLPCDRSARNKEESSPDDCYSVKESELGGSTSGVVCGLGGVLAVESPRREGSAAVGRYDSRRSAARVEWPSDKLRP